MTELAVPALPAQDVQTPSLRSAATALFRRDLLLAARRRSDVATGLVFFVVVASLFPLGVGAEPKLLREIGAGVVWVSALLASLLALPRLFVADHEDGTLEQLLLVPHPLAVLALAKVAAHWLASGAPLVLMAPLIALQYGMDARAIGVLVMSLAIGTPALALIGAIGAALSLGLRGAGALTALLVLPLNTPILIFGAGAVTASMSGLDPWPWLSLQGAVLAVTAALAPWALAHGLRVAVE
jgi:heme exporter protein B